MPSPVVRALRDLNHIGMHLASEYTPGKKDP